MYVYDNQSIYRWTKISSMVEDLVLEWHVLIYNYKMCYVTYGAFFSSSRVEDFVLLFL